MNTPTAMYIGFVVGVLCSYFVVEWAHRSADRLRNSKPTTAGQRGGK